MTLAKTLPEMLAHEGIADLTGTWSTDTIESWNRRLDPLFSATSDQARSYVGADDLVSTGVFHELFTEPVRKVIAGIHPTALLYHCHCYEIAAGQHMPHIHQGVLQGWHRDTETIKDFTPSFPTFVSIFILLSPVGANDGAFEFAPQPPDTGLSPGGEIVQLVGPAGTAAIWNRSYFHRASPNLGPLRRRILKISFQPAGLANDRIGLDEFTNAWAHLNDEHLRELVDSRRTGSVRLLSEQCDPVDAKPLRPTATNSLTSAAVTFGRLQSAARRVMSAARVG